MPGKNKADRETVFQENMTEEEKRIDELLREHGEITRKIKALESRVRAEIALLRQQIREKTAEHDREFDSLGARRQEIRDFILAYWQRYRKNTTTLEFPSAMVSRRDYRELVVYDPAAVLNALDRIGRLDLVKYVFQENEVARLYADGELKGLDTSALEVRDHFNLQVRPRRKHG